MGLVTSSTSYQKLASWCHVSPGFFPHQRNF
ncbi:hypothetical protein F443_14773 [Phytophthora nicotianae P1569]|uniref:Uncharacterized protein n=2 Tax=Phytophthora nicotianae TaxID=4792 RepID=V9EL32_PHYNI|nr:hypothetical protein F443_14773 [Phytophthora nicotianae P1569]ETO68371.1 hypothetical protein F444_14776 [Phytophthora nicotianae P1976]